tara:strand:+ start:450 stop:1340 length:891 start_codon:yes stop_codon:yes gene_type:complete
MNRGPEKIGRFLGGMIVIALCLLLSSCSSFRLATVNDDMYPVDYVIPVSNETKIDTIDSYFKLKYKLRTDFNFRWDFAQYAMQQPYSWYWNNPRLDGIWRPYNRFDVYFYSNWFWSDWTWNYPYNNFYGWNHWYRPWGYHNWNYSWYNGPWHNSSYNVVWNSSRRGNNVAYINGPRSSRNSIVNIIDNSNSIENNISRRYNNPRPNNNTVINRIVNTFRENNIKVNINNKPMINNNKPNYNINNTRPTYNNNNFNSNNSIRNNNSFSTPPPSGNISRGSSTSRGGSSRGGNSRGNN